MISISPVSTSVVTTASAWITLRYRSSVTNNMQALVDGQRWNIIDVQPDERKRTMRLFCEKVVT